MKREQTASGKEVSGFGSESRFELPPKVHHLPRLTSLVPKPPAPRLQPLGLVRFEMSKA